MLKKLKYAECELTFSEVPGEITLCISLTNCPNKCKGCHSPYLAQDIGKELDLDELLAIYNKNIGITCICFMGGDNYAEELNQLALDFIMHYPQIKLAWYSGKDYLDPEISLCIFDYVKVGSYKEELGGLASKLTNQKFYKVENCELIDITSKFWK